MGCQSLFCHLPGKSQRTNYSAAQSPGTLISTMRQYYLPHMESARECQSITYGEGVFEQEEEEKEEKEWEEGRTKESLKKEKTDLWGSGEKNLLRSRGDSGSRME